VVVAFTGVEVDVLAPVVVPVGEIGPKIRFPQPKACAPECHLQARVLVGPIRQAQLLEIR